MQDKRLRPRVVGGGRLQPALRIPQALFNALGLGADHQSSDEADREHWAHPHELVRDDVEPAADGGLLPAPSQRRDGQLDPAQ